MSWLYLGKLLEGKKDKRAFQAISATKTPQACAFPIKKDPIDSVILYLHPFIFAFFTSVASPELQKPRVSWEKVAEDDFHENCLPRKPSIFPIPCGDPRTPNMHCLVWKCEPWCVRPSCHPARVTCRPRASMVRFNTSTVNVEKPWDWKMGPFWDFEPCLKWPCCALNVHLKHSLNRLYALVCFFLRLQTRQHLTTRQLANPTTVHVWSNKKHEDVKLWLNWAWCQAIHHSCSKNSFQKGPRCLILKETCVYSELNKKSHTNTSFF